MTNRKYREAGEGGGGVEESDKFSLGFDFKVPG